MTEEVYLIDGLRTPILKARGRPGPFSSADLATYAGRSLLMRSGVSPADLDETILGCVMPSEREANIGRVASLRIGIPEGIPAWTVQRNCASGMQSIDSAHNRIQLGLSDLVLAGGVEAMSRAPVMFSSAYVNFLADLMADLMAARSAGARLKAVSGFRPSMLKPVFALEHGLTDPVVSLNMGQTAERIAERFGVTRAQMDKFSVQSHLRAARAQEEGLFADEIIPLFDGSGKLYDRDDGVRPDSSAEKLAKLKPVFEKPFGRVTAANSSQISDGAAWVLLASARAVEKYDLQPVARIREVRWAALDPAEMGLGPAHAIADMLVANQWGIADIDCWEINEAFAGQVLACVEALDSEQYCRDVLGLAAAIGRLPADKLNPQGGAVACGHPVGMSGARIVLHLANTLTRTGGKRGIASLCIGGGQGGATLVERI